MTNRQIGLCLLCHSGPFPEERFQGDLAPDLRGVGARWSEGQLRLRIVDARKLNPETIMPPYYVVDGLNRVAPVFSRQAGFDGGADRGCRRVSDDTARVGHTRGTMRDSSEATTRRQLLGAIAGAGIASVDPHRAVREQPLRR